VLHSLPDASLIALFIPQTLPSAVCFHAIIWGNVRPLWFQRCRTPSHWLLLCVFTNVLRVSQSTAGGPRWNVSTHVGWRGPILLTSASSRLTFRAFLEMARRILRSIAIRCVTNIHIFVWLNQNPSSATIKGKRILTVLCFHSRMTGLKKHDRSPGNHNAKEMKPKT